MKIYIKSSQSIMAGTKYDQQAADILVNKGKGFDKETATKVIDDIFYNRIHAFKHAPAWLEKYLKGIARLIVTETRGRPKDYEKFITNYAATFNDFLIYVRVHRDELGGAAFDNKFNNTLKLSDIRLMLGDIKRDTQFNSYEETADLQFDGATNYKLVPIRSYAELHAKFGGPLTGDGKDPKTFWCWANSETDYNNYIAQDGYHVYVIVNPDYKNIKFNAESNAKNPKDEYGLSLICVVVDDTGNHIYETLRSNHLGLKYGFTADTQFYGYRELSEAVGFDVKTAIAKDLASNRK